MRFFLGVALLALAAGCAARTCPGKKSNSKLFCYYGKLTDVVDCYCTHAILPANSDVKAVEKARESLKGVKILVTVHEFNQGLINLLKNSKVDGLEINLKKLDSKNDINDFISTVRSKLGSDLYLALSVPSKADILAKYYDFKTLSKHADLFILQTAFLGASKNVTFHPSRLSGMWDMQNTDSVVDLVSGLGAPLSKLIISAPVQAFRFTLQNEEYTAPGSPALEVKSLTRDELCEIMSGKGNWTLERDEDQAGPYIFSKDQWIAFEDSTSMDLKAKYSRVRGLAGIALKDVSQDGGDKCGVSILEAAYNGLSRQARAPRGAVLHSLEREIREASQPLDHVHVSPYRISRIIDVEGKIHSVRQDTRTEFQCSRQGYFVHPRSCNRFYRCVKFDQLVDDFNVFEFDCPAGLAFDERVEVCVWPGSLPHGTPCAGSSEIAPVPRQRFDCPAEQGYYADPENCRWFFACLDHGRSPLTAYEFRCPFGLVFDSERLLCEWPWLVPKCGSGLGVNLASEYVYGGYSTGHGSGLLLGQYDGLGALGAVKLGGISGKIEQPLVYSNVGTSGLGYNNGGYINQNGHIVGNGLGGLSYKAAQSLQNAGLLRADLGAGTGSEIGYQHGGTVLTGLSGQSNLQYSGVGAVSSSAGLGTSNQYQYNSGAAGTGAYQQGGAILTGLSGQQYSGAGSAGAGGSSQYQYNSGAAGAGSYQQGGGILTGLSGQSQLQHSGEGSAGLGSSSQYQYNSGAAGTGAYQQGGAILTGLSGQSQVQHSGAGSAGLGSSSQYQYNSGAAGAGAYQQEGVILTGLSGQSQVQHSRAGSAGLGSSSQYQYNSGAAGADAYQQGGVILTGLSGQSQVQHSGAGSAGLGSSSQYQYNSGAAGAGAYQQEGVILTGLSGQSQLQHSGVESAGLDSSSQYQYNSGASGLELDAGNLNIAGAYGTKTSSADGLNAQLVSGVVHTGANLGYNLDYSANAGAKAFGATFSQSGLQYQGTNAGQEQYHSNLDHNVGNVGTVNTAYSQRDLGAKVGATSSQSFTQYHGQSQPVVGVNSGEGSGVNVVIGNAGLNQEYNAAQYQENAEAALGFGAKLNQGQILNQVDLNQGAFGAKSAQSYTQYSGGTVGQGVAGNINIIGGGYSAVGESTSGVEVNSNGESIGAIVHSTPAPVQVTTFAAVPTVTSVPIPALKTASGFETYKGGVVANIPQLQYKIQDTNALANISANFVKFVSTTPATFYSEGTKLQGNGGGATSYSYQSSDSSIGKGQGIAVSGYSGSSTLRPAIAVVQQNAIPTVSIQRNEGYVYSKPSVAFEEGPARAVSTFSISSTPRPNTYIQPVQQVQPVISVQPVVHQPAISTYQRQDFSSEGHSYEQAAVGFGVRTQPQIVVSSTVQPIVERRPQVYVSSTAAPVVQHNAPAVSSYSFTQNVASQGYDYPKPVVAFEEQPVVQTYQTVKPAVISKFSIRKPTVQPAIVSTYNVQPVQPTVASYSYEQAYKSGGYNYAKPSVAFEETPTRSAVVSTYQYQQPQAVQPTVAYQKPTSYTYQNVALEAAGVYQPNKVSTYNYVTSSTPAPVVLEQTARPAVVSSYSYTPSTTSAPAIAVQNVNFGGYDYPKPAVAFAEEPRPVVATYENRQPVEEVPFVKQKAYVTGQANNYQYSQSFETPVVTQNYQVPVKSSVAPVIVENYQAPVKASVTPVVVENYQTPVKTYSQSVDTSNAYFFNNVNTVSNTPVYQQDVIVQTTPRPTYKSTVSSVLLAKAAPTTESPHFYYYDSRLASTPKAVVQGYNYPKPQVRFEETPVRPVASTTYLPPTREYLPAQTSKPISSFSFSALDAQFQSISTPRPFTVSTTPLTREFIPVTTKIQVTTPQPTFVVPEISAPTYVPVRSKIRYTTSRPVEVTAPAKEYLPVTLSPVVTPTVQYLPVRSRVTSTSAPIVDSEYVSRRPAKVTIIKQNDLHPMLAAKLGAQCTCVSNTLNLRKKQKIIIVDDDDDDDGYVVANDAGRVIENYQYNPDTVQITPTPQVYLPSTSGQAYTVRKRVRVRPVTSQPDILLRNDVGEVSDREVASAVRTGLKLVKQAAKEGAEEAISNHGLANVRDTIDCQRAGLFRHPTQCNKFYSCRWDCTKNKFTLHTFNCPVHLTFDGSLGACNWPSQGPACLENTLLPSE